MFRKDIVDDILTNLERSRYVGDGKGTGGWSNNYIYYKFADIVADVPDFIDMLYKQLDADASDPTAASSWWRMMGDLGRVCGKDSTNRVPWYLHRDNYRYSQLVDINSTIVELVESHDKETAITVLTDHLKAVYIDAFMDDVHKVWILGAHEGSQIADSDAYRILISAMCLMH